MPTSGVTLYTYDLNGNVTTKTDPRGVVINYNPSTAPIDVLNRVHGKTYSDPNTPPVFYSYDLATNGIGRPYEEDKQLQDLINNYTFAPGEKLNIVAHSHGNNIALAATHLGLKHKIDNLISLGGPKMKESIYQPNLKSIGTWSNFTSPQDWVQKTFSSDGTNPRLQNGAHNHQLDFGTGGGHSTYHEDSGVIDEWLSMHSQDSDSDRDNGDGHRDMNHDPSPPSPPPPPPPPPCSETHNCARS